jgi:hypothetical protein
MNDSDLIKGSVVRLPSRCTRIGSRRAVARASSREPGIPHRTARTPPRLFARAEAPSSSSSSPTSRVRDISRSSSSGQPPEPQRDRIPLLATGAPGRTSARWCCWRISRWDGPRSWRQAGVSGAGFGARGGRFLLGFAPKRP